MVKTHKTDRLMRLSSGELDSADAELKLSQALLVPPKVTYRPPLSVT